MMKVLMASLNQPFVRLILPIATPVPPDNPQGQNRPDQSPCQHSQYWVCLSLPMHLLIQDYPWIDNYGGGSGKQQGSRYGLQSPSIKYGEISNAADGGLHSCVCACMILHLAPPQHKQKFSGA